MTSKQPKQEQKINGNWGNWYFKKGQFYHFYGLYLNGKRLSFKIAYLLGLLFYK
jgi:hypothetical protein